MSDCTKPYITVVMPVRNEARFIRDTLQQLVSQDYTPDRFEIIVVDGLSDDGTQEIVRDMAKQHLQIRLLDNPKRVSSAGRNIGFRSGQGDIFLVVDGHCLIPTDRLLSNVADCFAKSGADCLGRPQPLDPPDLTPFQRAVALARGSRLGHGADSLIYGGYEGFASPVSNGAAYRREVFDKVGYVDENFDAAEDVEHNYRIEQAGLRCYTSPRLTVHYYPRESLKGLFRQMLRYGMGRSRFIGKHREALTISQLVPTAFVIGLLLQLVFGLCSAIQFPDHPEIRTVCLSATQFISFLYGFYAVIVISESLRLAHRHGWGYMKYLPLTFFTIHFGLGCGFINDRIVMKN